MVFIGWANRIPVFVLTESGNVTDLRSHISFPLTNSGFGEMLHALISNVLIVRVQINNRMRWLNMILLLSKREKLQRLDTKRLAVC